MSDDEPGAAPARGGDGRARDGPSGRGERLARTARVMGARRYRQARRRLHAIRDRADDPVAPALDRAAPAAQLEDLFEYPRKRRVTAYLLWGFAGLLGAHRFYLDREGTAAAQFFTGGGLGLWWAADAFLLPTLVREYNREQAEREAEGRPPRTLDFLETDAASAGGDGPDAGDDPAAAAGPEAGGAPGGEAGGVGELSWARDRATGRGRLAADLAVVAFAGLALGGVSAETGAWRGAAAVATVVAVIGFAPEMSGLRGIPGVGDLLRWAARIGLFYRYHDPGGPLSRLARPLAGILYAPFRRRSRAEAHLWLEVGGAFAVVFFLVDLVAFGGALVGGEAELAELPARWGASAVLTMVNVYMFASPVGATLYEYVLAGRSHRRVWLLGATALLALGAGLATA